MERSASHHWASKTTQTNDDGNTRKTDDFHHAILNLVEKMEK
jgi:hypothetical protein